jgi:hypothetical protein
VQRSYVDRRASVRDLTRIGPTLTIVRAWRRARAEVFTPEVAAGPYDLRHAAVSTWLNGGVPVTTVAEWAGPGGTVSAELWRVFGTDSRRQPVSAGHSRTYRTGP